MSLLSQSFPKTKLTSYLTQSQLEKKNVTTILEGHGK